MLCSWINRIENNVECFIRKWAIVPKNILDRRGTDENLLLRFNCSFLEMTKTGILKGIPDAYLVLIQAIYELKGVKLFSVVEI